MNQPLDILFDNYKLGDVTLNNRIIMASLTRCRANPNDGAPTDIHVRYYSQRASAGLLLTECSQIAANGYSFPGAPGIYTPEQTAGWKRVVDAVHEKGGKIFMQIWHAGRSAHPLVINETPIGPSAIAIKGELRTGVPHVVPKEMTKEDISLVIEQFRQGALNAKEAGFDGIELHGANGYLVDEFIRDGSNHRTDEYGGSVEKRARFALEAIDALISVFGAGRVGIKLSPVGRYQDMYDSDPVKTYSYLLEQLDKKGIAYVQLVESGETGTDPTYVDSKIQMAEVAKTLRPFFSRTIMTNLGLTPETAAKAITEGSANVVSFGKYFISNPDFVERVKNQWKYSEWDQKTFYQGGEKGYIDYPFYKDLEVKA